MWECRYIARELPERFTHHALSRGARPRYDVLATEVHEIDDYLLASTPTLNLKVRHRSNSLKLKSLQAVSADRLERWHTDFEHTLPADAQVWDRVLRLLDCHIESGPVSRVDSAEGAVTALRPFLASAQLVRVSKVRWLYSDGRGRLEVSQIVFRAERFATVCVEGAEDVDVRDLLNDLAVTELGRPRNYMELLHQPEIGRSA